MREKLRDKERLQHILDAIETLTAKDIEYWEVALANDPIAFYGACKLIEIIGEAVYKLTKEYKAAHPEIEWNDISGMRHIIVHDYYMVSKSVVLAVIKKDLPILQTKIAALYENY